MVLQCKKKACLLELLESHVGGFTPEVAVQPRSPTPFPTHTSPFKQPEKKRKGENKGKEVSENGEIAPSKDLEP